MKTFARKFSLFVLPFLLCAVSHAQVQPTFSLDFENGANAIGANGKIIAPRVEGKLEFQDGKFGKALKSGPDSGYLHFPTAGVLSPREGTVELWVSPLDWKGNERAFHSFFDARGEGALYLYKYFSSAGLLMLTAPSTAGPYLSASANVEKWQPGEWHHIAGTWSPRMQAVYVDGKRIATQPNPQLPAKLDDEFRLGDHPWNEPTLPRTSSSLIDRVRVYDRALSPTHIAAHFAGDYSKVVAPSLKDADLDWTVNAKTRAITPSIAIAENDEGEKNLRADFSISQGERIVQKQEDRAFNELLISDANFNALEAPGDYELRVALRDTSGKSYGQMSKTLTVPDTAKWMNSTLGEKPGVLPPWTPLQVKKNADGTFSVLCWGREYQFGNSVWPVQIVSKNETLLAAPIELQILNGGKEHQWKNASAKIVSQSPEAVEIEGRAQLASAPGVLLSTKMRLEFDGMMLATFHLQAPADFKPEIVRLDIPMRDSNALYRHRWSAGKRNAQKTFTSALKKGEGAIDNSDYLPAAWLGDNERGLFWFCESAQHWPNWKSESAFQTLCGKYFGQAVVVQRFNLLDGQPLPQNWSYQFGLQATPVKPFPRDWRARRLAPATRANLEIYWPSGAPDSMLHFGYAAAANPELFQKRVDESHAKGRGVLPYSLLNGTEASAPEWKWFHDIWDVHHKDPPAQVITPTQESWRDFVIWKNLEFLKKYQLDGFYHDLTYPYGWAVPEANTGWFDGQEWQQTFPMLSYRELYRRHYATIKGANPNAFLIGHISARLAIPVVGYEDAYLDGEPFRGHVQDSYMDVMGLDGWRIGYTGRQWGVIPILLPEFNAENSAKIEPTRGLAALAMLHDTSVWPIWSNVSVWNEIYDALDAFGYVDSEFIPYFDPTPPATTDMKDAYISVYKRADGRALAIVGNTSREDRSGTVTLNAKRIGLPTSGVLSWPDKTPVTQNGTKIKLDVPRLGYRMLLIGKAP
jgi:hypothetical protein